ncbi:hypothetical protein HanXRQr2_Chr07g0303041 [Helianthus annuus]|uniref:Uncharacterized protein n=1 Tax=Helianthus annuus TaxID=4232 RepID=A0A9K3IM22_HELAN|nr:hypothetical protein HanXRQr2_Chr07g0303041 [Helianthus annuus]KAJ0905380.1 hypothetical protein HanPSC8_Chr07g0293311 [Helianthus annuus]
MILLDHVCCLIKNLTKKTQMGQNLVRKKECNLNKSPPHFNMYPLSDVCPSSLKVDQSFCSRLFVAPSFNVQSFMLSNVVQSSNETLGVSKNIICP